MPLLQLFLQGRTTSSGRMRHCCSLYWDSNRSALQASTLGPPCSAEGRSHLYLAKWLLSHQQVSGLPHRRTSFIQLLSQLTWSNIQIMYLLCQVTRRNINFNGHFVVLVYHWQAWNSRNPPDKTINPLTTPVYHWGWWSVLVNRLTKRAYLQWLSS